MLKSIGIIPARYGSSRLPGKPLIDLGGKSMIQRVYEQCKMSDLDEIIVATDDSRIEQLVQSFGGRVVMTDPEIPSGTERCAAAIELLNNPPDIVINVQGDEPFIAPEQINQLIKLMQNEHVQLGTLFTRFKTIESLHSPNRVKLVINHDQKVLLFSRSVIPFSRDNNYLPSNILKHIGLYGYKKNTLAQIVQLDPCIPEQSERLEQLRWLYHGYEVHASESIESGIAIDTKEDVTKAQNYLKQ